MTRIIIAIVALAATFAAPAAFAQDDLDKLLDELPEIPNAEKEEEKDDAAPAPDAEAALPAYIKSVRSAVINQWQPKAKVVKKNPKAKAQFLVKIDVNGQMTGVSAVELSGVKSFDQSVLDAIANTTFPPPPVHILSDVERGVVVRVGAGAYSK